MTRAQAQVRQTVKRYGSATRQKHGGLAHYAQSQQTQIDIPKTNYKPKVDNMTGLAQLRASATARASAI